jgi:GNAT superfamily N-acetyltransferase
MKSASISTVKDFLATKAGLDLKSATDDTVILGSGLVDSFGLVALLAEVETEFGVFPDLMQSDPEEYATLGGLARLIAEQMGLGTEVANVSQPAVEDGGGVVRLTSSHPLWEQLPSLFELMFLGFRDQGLLIPLAKDGARIWLRQMGQMPEGAGIVLGAVVEGHLTGFAAGLCKSLPPHLGGGLVGEIAYVFVEESSRGKGVARQLVVGLENWMKSRRSISIELQVLAGNAGGQRFWQKMGFAPELAQMRKVH